MTDTWGLMPKNQIDNEKVEEAIDRIVGAHNDDPTAHLEEGQALTSHRASEIIDHRAKSIVNDKIIEVARSYTAIIQTPTTTVTNMFYGEPSYIDGPVQYVPSDKTFAEILNRGVSADDSEYVVLKYGTSGDNYFLSAGLDIPVTQKVYKIKIKFRAKIIDNTVASMPVELAFADGSTETKTITTSWQDFEKEMYYGQESDDVWQAWQGQMLSTGFIGLNISRPTTDNNKNFVGLSQFYIEAYIVDDIYKEDYFDLKSAVDYVNSLGGGSIFVKNGVYDMGYTIAWLNSNVSITGESLAGVKFTCTEYNDNIQIGSYGNVKYSAGTITLTQNSNVAIASGVTWTSANTVGNYLVNKVSGHYYKIISFIDSTHVTIEQNYQGATTAGLSYIIISARTENTLENVTLDVQLVIWGALNCRLDNVRQEKGLLNIAYCENLDMFDCEIIDLAGISWGEYVTNSTWSQNTFSNNTQTVMNFKATAVGNIVENNLIIDNKSQCILNFGSNNIIKGNVFLNNGWTLGQLYSAILLGNTSFKNIVCNNVLRNNNSYGIGSQSGANYNLVSGNICIDNYSAGVVNNGAQSVTANNIV